jgi:hypothetical protein
VEKRIMPLPITAASRIKPGWDPGISLVESLRVAQAPYREELKQLLSRSLKLLRPLGEPLLVDNPLTGILKDAREEIYSDLLAWSLRQLETPQVLSVLGINLPNPVSTSKVEVLREHPVPVGHPGSAGRLDIRISAGLELIADVEVKLGQAEASDLEKQAGYAQFGASHPILIASAGARDIYPGKYRLRKWADVCISFREAGRELLANGQSDTRKVMHAGLILAFVAAVEENLLGVPGPLLRAVYNDDAPLILGEGAEGGHLKEWVSRGGE